MIPNEIQRKMPAGRTISELHNWTVEAIRSEEKKKCRNINGLRDF